jgi:hypothetical protein
VVSKNWSPMFGEKDEWAEATERRTHRFGSSKLIGPSRMSAAIYHLPSSVAKIADKGSSVNNSKSSSAMARRFVYDLA